MRRITVFTGNRAEYGLLNPVIKALYNDADFQVRLLISGAHLSSKFGNTVEEVDMAKVAGIDRVELNDDGEDASSLMVTSFGEVVKKVPRFLRDQKPDILFLAGDRYETFAVATIAYYSNVPIAHMFGGDLSQGGHLDDSVRHAVTKLAHLHFVTNQDAFERVLRLGEEPWRVFNFGSPAVDNVLSGECSPPELLAPKYRLDIGKPILLFTQHPVTTESGASYVQVKESLEALAELGLQTVLTYPCDDTGSEGIIKALHEYEKLPHFRIVKSLGWKDYLGLMKICGAVVGNSSSGIMETPIVKVPAVNIGSRQLGRLRAGNVIDVPYDRKKIKEAILRAINDHEFIERVKKLDSPYGTGGTGERVAQKLKTVELGGKLLQKRMTY